MTDDRELTQAGQGADPALYPEMGGGPAPQDPSHPFRRLHAILRGRYHWVALLGIAGGLIGGVSGYEGVKPKYRSDGMIEIAPTKPSLDSDRDQPVVMFESFVRAQVALLKMRRVIELAMTSPEWQKVQALRAHPMTVEQFSNALQVEHEPDQQDVFIHFTADDPHAAMVATRADIEAYLKLSSEMDAASDNRRFRLLSDQESTLKNHVADLRSRISDIASEYGTRDLEQVYTFKSDEAQRFENDLLETSMALAAAESAMGHHAAPTATTAPSDNPAKALEGAAAVPPAPLPPPSPEDVARIDPEMRGLLHERDDTQDRLKQFRQQFGEDYPTVVEARTHLNSIDDQVRQIMKRYASGIPGPALGSSGMGADSPAMLANPASLAARARSLQTKLDALHNEALTIGQKKLKIDDLEEELKSTTEDLKRTTDLLNQFNWSIQLGGVVTPRSYGDAPFGPSNRGTRMQLAVLGALFLGGLGAGLVVLRGLADHRLKTIDDARSSLNNLPMLGILPRLPSNLNDPQEVAIAAHCVHQIRTLVQIGGGQNPNQVIAITSPAAETGKTSLTLALGLSFAACGSRTLMIDTDMVGRGLSLRTGARVRERLGQVLLRLGFITPAQLDEALAAGAVNEQLLGKVLVERGWLSVERLATALTDQEKTSLGLLDACAGLPLEFSTMRLNGKDLHILPVGPAVGRQAVALSPANIQRLVAKARESFDVVLIDTGPVPGSIEGSMVATVVDGVVLVVSQGDQKPLAEAAMLHLRSLGARIAGLVFNRADVEDIARSVYMSASREQASRSQTGESPSSSPSGVPLSPHLGPVASAVATAAPPSAPAPAPARGARRSPALPPPAPTVTE